MNTPGAGLSPFDALGVRAVVRALVTDTDSGGQSLTWYTRGARGYVPAAGEVSNGDTATALVAFVGPVTAKEVGGIQGAKVGDVRVLVAIDDLATVQVDDRFHHADTDWSVYLVESSPLETHHVCYARRA